jgi:hypothetical protein
MKKILKSLLFCCLAIAVIAGCKKNALSDIGEGTVSSQEYTFNRATKTFDLGNEVKSNISAAEGVKFVYCYLVRTNKTDSLIHVTDNKGAITPTYELSIPLTAFPVNNMSAVKGVKVLVKQGNNSSLEGFVTIKYFDPALPQFSAYPTVINADLSGVPTAITATVKSEYGIKQVDILDDYQTENTYVLVNSITNIANVKQYALNYAYTYRKAAQHIKIRAIDIYNQANELIINMPVDVSIFKPKFLNFAATITPNATGTTPVTGNINSITGLKKVDIYDDRNGSYELLATVSGLNGVKTYNYSANYAYAMRAEHIKIIAVDTEDLQSELVIPLNVTYLSKVYRDVVMNAQTLGTNTIFFDSDGATKGNCELNASELTMAFLFYATSSGPTFYAPTNTTNVASNFRCNNVPWVLSRPAADMRATRFRVLLPSIAAEKLVYDDFAANKLDDLAARLGSLAISSSGPRYDATATPTNAIFNTTANANLIAVKIPDVGNPNASKFAVIHVKECVYATPIGNSTIKFDIYIQK